MEKAPTTTNADSATDEDHPQPDKEMITPIRKTLSCVPISDPEDRLFNRKLKSYSQPLTRLDLHQPLYDHRKKQHSLQLSSSYSSLLIPANPNFIPSPSSPLPTNPLPEFTGAGGGSGMFSLPRRASMHPGRPPPLELRPHPFRETQTGCTLRAIATAGNYLWAGQENGVRCWDLDRVFAPRGEGKEREGDKESAPFWECTKTGTVSAMKMAPTTCLVVDEGREIVWTGHKDGKIESWKIVKEGDGEEEEVTKLRQAASWQAHKCAVLSMVLTSFGK